MHIVISWIYLFVSPLFLNRAVPNGEEKSVYAGQQTGLAGLKAIKILRSCAALFVKFPAAWKWTQTLIPTGLREAPADAEILSHKSCCRALPRIRKLAGGVYTFLPLGLRALRKVEKDCARSGAWTAPAAVEVLMPALQPPEIWQQSGALRNRQRRALQIEGQRHGRRNWVLSPTAEEVITTHCLERDQFLSPVAEEFLSSEREVPR